jgi:hypothetical protein
MNCVLILCTTLSVNFLILRKIQRDVSINGHIAYLPQQCHNSKCVIFQERILKVLKCNNLL